VKLLQWILALGLVFGLGWLSGAAHLRKLMIGGRWWAPALRDGALITVLYVIGIAATQLIRHESRAARQSSDGSSPASLRAQS